MKVLHRVKEHDSVSMAELRFALLESLENHAVHIRNRLASFVLPVSDRYPIGFAGRLHEVRNVCRQTPLLDFAGMSGIQITGIATYRPATTSFRSCFFSSLRETPHTKACRC